MGWKQFSPHKWCAFCVFFWGFVATIQATAFNWGGLIACRFFLGVAEGEFPFFLFRTRSVGELLGLVRLPRPVFCDSASISLVRQ